MGRTERISFSPWNPTRTPPTFSAIADSVMEGVFLPGVMDYWLSCSFTYLMTDWVMSASGFR
jgi:hypothetical protein